MVTVKKLKEILSQYDDELVVLIDKSDPSTFSDVTYMEEGDIQRYDDERIIINYQT